MARVVLRLAFWAAVALTTASALLPQPPELEGLPSDKGQHVLAFAVLSVACLLAYPQAPRLRLALGLAAYGAAIELAQLIPALHRSADLLDWLVDAATVAVMLPLADLVRRRLATRFGGTGA